MSKRTLYIVFILLSVITFTMHAQLVVSTALTPQQLVQNILAGSGVTVSNVTYTGDPNAIGSFSGTTSLGISSGVVMTTGTVQNTGDGPQGPNNLNSSGVDNGYPGDADLTTIAGTVTKNAAILEFDFVPSGDTIKFNYVFGSEEYPEYVCSNFNDVFAFLISGQNPLGGNYVNENIAIIPGTNLAVAINSVNPGVAGAFSFGGACTSLSYSNHYVDNTVGATIQYDGYTKVLGAVASVVCGSTYHLKLAISDAVDGVYDSGVFLEAGSLITSKLKINPKVAFGINDSTMFEGCSSAQITFTRNSNISGSDTVTISFNGTAINNVDYNISSPNLINGNKLFFNPGDDSISVSIQALQDFLGEPIEGFILDLSYKLCNNTYTETVKFYIQDTPLLEVKASNDTTLTCPNPITINALASGGISIGNYVYSWNSGQKTKSFIDTPTQTTQYIVTATDTCGTIFAKDTVNVTLNYIPLQLATSNDTSICKGETVTLTANASNGFPLYKYTWQSSGLGGNSIVVAPLTTTIYTITATDSCKKTISKQIKVNVPSPRAAFSYDYVTNSELNFLNAASNGVVSWQWDFGDATVSTLVNPTHTYADSGTYLVGLVVTNNLGCTDTVYENVIVYPDLYFYFPNAFTPNGDGLNDTFGGKGVGIVSYQMQLFDRWGELIFTSSDINIAWDGLLKGNKDAPIGVYVCKFDVIGERGAHIIKTESVTLIR